mmetsp:Transcript_29764/g.95727  ORF Transcript_29764/g.95727 Transcript_29764/m.95727 type:complete len:666 (+) Transcript_29764:196-2193(+)
MVIRVTGKSLQAFLLVLALAIVGLRIYAHSRFENSVNHPSNYQSSSYTVSASHDTSEPPAETPSPTPNIPNCMVDFNPVLCGKLATEGRCRGVEGSRVGDAWAAQYIQSVCPETCSQRTGEKLVCQSENKVSDDVPWRPSSITGFAKVLASQVMDFNSAASLADDAVWRERMHEVQGAFNHSFQGYMKYAWGKDTLRPLSKQGVNNMGSMGATIIDSLDTMLIMGLEDSDMYRRSRNWVDTELVFATNPQHVSTFETNIRVLGGLLSAYDLSGGDELYLRKAIDLGNRLLWAFKTDNGLPVGRVLIGNAGVNQGAFGRGSVCLAEIGTMQIEFIALSERSGDPKYAEAAVAVIDLLEYNNPPNGLYSTQVTWDAKPAGGMISFGGSGDSYYEYLLKIWVYGGRGPKVQRYLDMWQKSIGGMWSQLESHTAKGTMFLKEGYNMQMGHLACFAAGMLAYGASDLDAVQWGREGKLRNYTDAERTWKSGEELENTCFRYYHDTPSGLSGEEGFFQPGQAADFTWRVKHNIQRPEAIESVFYFWRLTGDIKYRQQGWEMWQAFQTQKIPSGGYSGVRDVTNFKYPGPDASDEDIARAGYDDEQQTFWLAETLKYFYLLFAPVELIPLTDYVFNTEAHPVMIQPESASAHFKWAGVMPADDQVGTVRFWI